MSSILPPNRPDLETPVIRAVEAFPINDKGERRICLRDPQRIAKNTLMLSPAAVYILTLCDGTRTIDEIRLDSAQQLGQELPREQIEQLIAQLDAELYLESKSYQDAVIQLEAAFRAAPHREAFHAGGAYEGDAVALAEKLNTLQDEARSSLAPDNNGGPIAALVSPHIDLHRGGPCFAHAYNELAARDGADLYVIFGTGHQSRRSLFIATKKSYDTPLGLVETDDAFIDEFNRRSAYDVFDEELLHRDEHSIEFQALWLKHINKDRPFKIAPILTGSLHSFVREGKSPRDDAQLTQSLDALRELIDAYDGRVTVIAGADMSHVGRRFGHETGIPQDELERVEREDRELLDAMEACDAERFYQSIADKKDRNNVCGLSPIYFMLDAARPSRGRLLNYARAVETESESVVTYASLSFYAA